MCREESNRRGQIEAKRWKARNKGETDGMKEQTGMKKGDEEHRDPGGRGEGFWRAILSSVSAQEQLNEHRVCK